MAETLVRMAGPVAGTGADATLYTVPGATSIDLRNVHLVNNDTANPQTCKMSIGADAAGNRIIPPGFSIAASQVVDLDLHLTLLAGDVIHWNGNANITVTLSGIAVT